MFTSTNPATGEVVARHRALTPAETEAKLAAAASAFADWRRVPVAERAALLARIADRFESEAERLARMATGEMGKTLVQARAEVAKCVAAFRFYAEAGPAMLEAERFPIAAGGEAEVRRSPLGPVLAVMPWNFPYWQAIRFLAPTLLAGNAALLKHASIVQGAAALMERVALAAGAPAGLFQNLAVPSSAVAAIIADERVVAATLTGSEAAGAAVAEQAGRRLKPVVLELGGSDPFVVMPSADLDRAAQAAVTARIQNAGQSCICAKRMIVHDAVFDAFHQRFAAGMRAVRVGDPLDPDSDMGPLSSFGQRETVLAQLDDARRLGATLQGGEAIDGPGAFMRPGVLTGVPADSPFRHEEVFGPVAALYRARDLDDAVRLANDTPFGLGSSVWTDDAAEQERFVTGIEAGMTAINQMLASTQEAPFGGVKRSGFGRELGPFGLHAFTNAKTVLRAPVRKAGQVE